MESAAEGLELRLKREASDVATLRIDLAAVTQALEDSERSVEEWKVRSKKADQDRREVIDQHEALAIVKMAVDKELDRCKLQAQRDAVEMAELMRVIADLEELATRTTSDVAALKHQVLYCSIVAEISFTQDQLQPWPILLVPSFVIDIPPLPCPKPNHSMSL